jgi:proteic killer suppression protein
MKIDFADKELKKCANDDSYRLRKMGKIRAKLFKQRLDEIAIAETLEDLRYLPGNYHELTNNRKGQWGVNLEQPYRLIFEPQSSPIPTDTHGKYVWIEIVDVIMIEIINYHKES